MCSYCCSARAFMPHIAWHSPVQTACPEHAMPQAGLALAGGRTAPCAAPQGHRIPAPSGRGKMQGKIKGRGTVLREKPVCTWGGRGTRPMAAACRQQQQYQTVAGEAACIAPLGALDFAGVAT
ncbi:TPA: hypothetical protein PXM78_002678 [Yersinia enterocolitica]|nr:hypothetical protein [Yersinia enterocolitica]HDL6909003.1 hypothetical protein [Yersinia enterocolitica]HDL7027381.1 hypothetical protein [Yersinia enterocolitica]HDL7036131.1 hypothetical protein [Yersinia enterocolitica]HDL7200828.1 hypothetical protein [Yersinia enterocolitica]